MCYFPSIFLALKMLVCLHVCFQALAHAKRNKQEEEKNVKESSISSEKQMDCSSLNKQLFLMKK